MTAATEPSVGALIPGEWTEDVTLDSAGRLELHVVDKSEVNLDPRDRAWLEGRRRAAQQAKVIGQSPRLALALLSFIAKNERVDIDSLIEQGPRATMFSMLLDLYDAELLYRDGSVVSVSPEGVALLERAELPNRAP